MHATAALSRAYLTPAVALSQHQWRTVSETCLRAPPSLLRSLGPQNGQKWSCAAGGDSAPNLYQPFRPPTAVAPVEQSSKEEMLQTLTERMGLWHEWAPLITLLQRQGISPSEIDEATGLTGVEQNMTVVGAQVYMSLEAQGVSEEELHWFDVAGAAVLYELRVLAVNQRRSAAEYTIKNNLDAKGVRELAKAIKDHERKRGGEGRDHFTQAPGDALAFQYYRNAKETTSEDEREALVEQGLSVVVTEQGRKMLEELLKKNKDVRKTVTARLQLVRLQADETTPRAVAVVGDLAEVSAADIEAAPVAQTDTLFPIFTVSGAAKWVAIPGWAAIGNAAAPIALLQPDIKNLPGDTGAKASGPALVVVDRSSRDVDEEHYYLVEREGAKGLTLVSGADATSVGQVLGRVIVAVRPASKNAEVEEIDWV